MIDEGTDFLCGLPRTGPCVRSQYLDRIYDPAKFGETIKRAAAYLAELAEAGEINGIAFRGSSGAAVAFPCAFWCNLPMLHVHKPYSSHCAYLVEGDYRITRAAIVDDFVSSGSTLRTIVTEIHEAFSARQVLPPEFPHVVLYKETGMEWVDADISYYIDRTRRAHPALLGARIHNVYKDL